MDRNRRIPKEFYESFVKAQSESENAWEEAKEKADFSIFAPHLQKMIDMTAEMTGYTDPEKEVYDALLDQYEKGMDSATMDRLFEDLKAELIPLVQKVLAAKQPDDSKFHASFDKNAQKEVEKLLLSYIGFDWNRGTTGESTHPFTLNFSSKDVRVTNHFYEHDPLSAMYSAIHEGGHAIFEQNVNPDYDGTVAGSCSYMGIHESQSRFYENILGRNKNFWIPVYAKVQEKMPQLQDVSLDEFYKEHGYIPALKPGEKETVADVSPWEKRQPVAVTLGTAYDEWCLSQIAAELGKKEDAEYFLARSYNYRNLFNPETRFFHPKDKDGKFIEGVDYRYSGGLGARDYYDENNGYIFAAVQCVDGFGGTDTCQVTVSLIAEHQTVRPKALDGGGKGGSASMGGFLPINVYIVVDKYGTSHRRDANSFIFHSHFFDYLGNQFVNHAMTASRAIMHGIVVHQSRFLGNQVLRFDNIFFCHNYFSLSVGEPYEKLHELYEYSRSANIYKQFEVVPCYNVHDDRCQGKYQKENIQYVSYFVRIHFLI